ncbi:MAG TPA: MFS transporter [Anaerolineae bacterium]|nr:MFS transporter [Anaerolineae bacterium]
MTSTRKAWAVMLAAYLAGVAIALNQSKVPPVMQVLLRDLHMDTATGGWLMSAFAIAGIILGIPAAFVLSKLGPKSAGLIAIGCTLVGSIIGALATGAALLLGGRAVEGIGLGLIAVIAPAVISMWFPPEKRGTPMGVWASWVPVGGFLMYNLAGPLQGSFGWQGIWWFGALVALIAFVIYAAVVSAPPKSETTQQPSRESNRSFGRMLFNPTSWILALVFATFNFSFLAYATWAPSYFNAALGVDPLTASFYASLTSLAIIPTALVAGWVLDRFKQRHLILTIALAVSGILSLLSFQLSSAYVVALYMIALGLVGGFIPAATFTLAPETMPDLRFAGLALGIVSVGQNLGMFLGPPIVGSAIAAGNWSAGILPLVAALVIGVAAAVWLNVRQTRSQVAQIEIPAA